MTAPRRQRIEADAVRLLSAGVTGGVFPGAAACVTWLEGDTTAYVCTVAGRLFPGGDPVRPDTQYDLASLTKPFVATAALRLIVGDKLDFDMRADSLIADVRGTPGGVATVEQIFRHTSGLAPWGGLYLDVPHERGSSAARRWMVAEAARRAEERRPTADLYSDLGYIIGGELVARAAGVSLDRALAREVLEPLGIGEEVVYAGALSAAERIALAESAPPTERCEWRGTVVRGEVHDENAAALGGISGHAGLFGTARGVSKLASELLCVLAGRSEFLPKEVFARALRREPGHRYRFGWDSKSQEGSSAGRLIGPEAFGHLGFTGTSIWCDPSRNLSVVLLTNRVHPTRANERIKGFRPAFHDGVVAAFDAA